MIKPLTIGQQHALLPEFQDVAPFLLVDGEESAVPANLKMNKSNVLMLSLTSSHHQKNFKMLMGCQTATQQLHQGVGELPDSGYINLSQFRAIETW